MENSLPRGVKPNDLAQLPDDVDLIVVNNSGSKNGVLSDRSLEVDNLDRVQKLLFQPVKNRQKH